MRRALKELDVFAKTPGPDTPLGGGESPFGPLTSKTPSQSGSQQLAAAGAPGFCGARHDPSCTVCAGTCAEDACLASHEPGVARFWAGTELITCRTGAPAVAIATGDDYAARLDAFLSRINRLTRPAVGANRSRQRLASNTTVRPWQRDALRVGARIDDDIARDPAELGAADDNEDWETVGSSRAASVRFSRPVSPVHSRPGSAFVATATPDDDDDDDVAAAVRDATGGGAGGRPKTLSLALLSSDEDEDSDVAKSPPSPPASPLSAEGAVRARRKKRQAALEARRAARQAAVRAARPHIDVSTLRRAANATRQAKARAMHLPPPSVQQPFTLPALGGSAAAGGGGAAAIEAAFCEASASLRKQAGTITAVDLSACALTDAFSARALSLLRAEAAPTLRSLVLSRSEIGRVGAAALCGLLIAARGPIQRLELDGCSLGDHGVRMIVRALLCAGGGDEDDEGGDAAAPTASGAASIASSSCAPAAPPSIETLSLKDNGIKYNGAAALAHALAAPDGCGIKTLRLASNALHADAAQALGCVLEANTVLTTLDLADNSIRSEGLAHLAWSLRRNTTLAALSLVRNRLGGAASAVTATTGLLVDAVEGRCGLRVLNLAGNVMPADAIRRIREAAAAAGAGGEGGDARAVTVHL